MRDGPAADAGTADWFDQRFDITPELDLSLSVPTATCTMKNQPMHSELLEAPRHEQLQVRSCSTHSEDM